jgi:uncharacterized membrane protein
MTDKTTANSPSDEPVDVAGVAVVDDRGVQAAAAVAVQGSAAVLVARFANQDAAAVAYEALREAEQDRALRIDGVLVVDADDSGKLNIRKMTDHHTRRGTLWGAVAGGVLAIIFPPALLAGIVGGGIVGAVIGKVGNLSTKDKAAAELAGVITPGSSGIVALVDLADVEQVKATIPPAEEVKAVPVDDATAAAVKDAAKAAGDETAAS